MWGRWCGKYRDQFPPPVRGGIVEHRFNAIKYGKLPQIHIHEVEIEGPFYDAVADRRRSGRCWATTGKPRSGPARSPTSRCGAI